MIDIARTDYLTFFFFVFQGAATTISQITKNKAHQYDQAAKLSLWKYLDTPYMFLAQVAVVGGIINGYEIIGLTLLVIGFVMKVRDVYMI